MLKFLIIVFLLGFIFFRTIGFFMKLLSGSSIGNKSRNDAYQQNSNGRQRPAGGNVNIDYVPGKKGRPTGEKFTGGEYVDFEEVE